MLIWRSAVRADKVVVSFVRQHSAVTRPVYLASLTDGAPVWCSTIRSPVTRRCVRSSTSADHWPARRSPASGVISRRTSTPWSTASLCGRPPSVSTASTCRSPCPWSEATSSAFTTRETSPRRQAGSSYTASRLTASLTPRISIRHWSSTRLTKTFRPTERSSCLRSLVDLKAARLRCRPYSIQTR